jgi:hypothetical protein
MGRIIIATGLFLGGWIAFGIRAQETPAPDKSRYNLFNPAPDYNAFCGITVGFWQVNRIYGRRQ